ncbi:MAG: InlB B-repeat-containing protein, partial [Clostridiales bacterium]|nr:InlB B-repeat-containing protein [Clostridiales bacterium]
MGEILLTGSLHVGDTGLTSFANLDTTHLGQITSLTFSENLALSDIQNLNTAPLSSLEALSLQATSVNDFSGWDVSGLINLTTLDAANTKSTNDTLRTIEPLFALPSIKNISFTNTSSKFRSFANQIYDITSLAGFPEKYPGVNFVAQQQIAVFPAKRDASTNTVTLEAPTRWLDGSAHETIYEHFYYSGAKNVSGDEITIVFSNHSAAEASLPGAFTYRQSFSSPSTYAFHGTATVSYTTLATCTATYESNGGTAITAETVNAGTPFSKPADPSKDHYTFGGWYTDFGLTTAYNFATPATKDITLYAKWNINQYTVTYTDGVDNEEVFA